MFVDRVDRNRLGRSFAEQLPLSRRHQVGLAGVDEPDAAAAAERYHELVGVDLK